MLHKYGLDDPVLWDPAMLAATRPLFDGLYEFRRRALLLGGEPS
jgi:hypothetical protein